MNQLMMGLQVVSTDEQNTQPFFKNNNGAPFSLWTATLGVWENQLPWSHGPIHQLDWYRSVTGLKLRPSHYLVIFSLSLPFPSYLCAGHSSAKPAFQANC